MPLPPLPQSVEGAERDSGISRVEALSDGVIAIIITIMVLELKVPHEEQLSAVLAMWPIFLAYALSYVYVGIYWVNHHRLFGHARKVTNGLVWSNLTLLFALSLVPFSTANLGEHHFSQGAASLYLATMLLPSVGYVWLQRVIRRTGSNERNAQLYHQQTIRKGSMAGGIYAFGFLMTLFLPWAGIGCAVIVALLWILPQSRIDELFGKA